MNPFTLTQNPIESLAQKWLQEAHYPNAGGMVTFEGQVRNHHNGKSVLRLEYSAYEDLVFNEGQDILNEAKERFELIGCAAIHRYGMLEIGDTAIWITTWAAHRSEAFDGTRFIIDQIKKRLPIWKNEYYGDQTHEWVYCRH